jgi:Ni,Fe-hydrogenase I cytochrome b subunit
MAQNINQEGSYSSPFLQDHSTAIRIWHWLTFLVISALMITVLLNSTLLNARKNSLMVQDKLKEKGVIITQEQAIAVSREYTEKTWGIHKILGMGLTILLISRILIELTQPGEEKLKARFRKVTGLYKLNDKNKAEYYHYLMVKRLYLLFYGFLLVLVLTGVGLALGHEVAFLGKIHRMLKRVHSFDQYVVYAFVLFHLFNVILADNGKSKGIVSGMINGNK